MEIKIPLFEREEVEVKETYIDENGHHQERIKKILVPTGRLLGEDGTVQDLETNKKDTLVGGDRNG